jgi:hypothetical protein
MKRFFAQAIPAASKSLAVSGKDFKHMRANRYETAESKII